MQDDMPAHGRKARCHLGTNTHCCAGNQHPACHSVIMISHIHISLRAYRCACLTFNCYVVIQRLYPRWIYTRMRLPSICFRDGGPKSQAEYLFHPAAGLHYGHATAHSWLSAQSAALRHCRQEYLYGVNRQP